MVLRASGTAVGHVVARRSASQGSLHRRRKALRTEVCPGGVPSLAYPVGDVGRALRHQPPLRAAEWVDTIDAIVKAEARFTRALKAGDVVFREGDAGRTMFVVRKGKVRISRQVRGSRKTFALLGPGEFFGEMAIINDAQRSASAEAVEDVQLLELDAQLVQKMVVGEAEIALRILQKLSRRLAEADSLIAVLTKRDPRTRVILGLLREAELHGVKTATPDAVLVTRDLDELSEELGVRRSELDEAVTRMIRVGVVRPMLDGLEISSAARLNEFLTFLEDRGIVQD
jgi:CRP/FNR family cyclic AMP-dependent transcriptional regulator